MNRRLYSEICYAYFSYRVMIISFILHAFASSFFLCILLFEFAIACCLYQIVPFEEKLDFRHVWLYFFNYFFPTPLDVESLPPVFYLWFSTRGQVSWASSFHWYPKRTSSPLFDATMTFQRLTPGKNDKVDSLHVPVIKCMGEKQLV